MPERQHREPVAANKSYGWRVAAIGRQALRQLGLHEGLLTGLAAAVSYGCLMPLDCRRLSGAPSRPLRSPRANSGSPAASREPNSPAQLSEAQ